MNDTSGKGSSNYLVLTEKKKKNQRLGGCVGIFFQLFDWNRILTKKKLSSNKLLPPAGGAKQASKKYTEDEKMPKSKLHLIANENSGGFPSSIKGRNCVVEVEQQHEMRVPGLVARLMGLESIPALQRDKSDKSSFSDTYDGEKKDSLGNLNSEAENLEVGLEMGVANAKNDSRPQKLLKFGTYERRVVTRFGSEALHIKGVLSRARKYNQHHHQLELAPPLKSPRITSGKNASRSSRLIGAATKILEPGLQATSRAKFSLTSSSPSIYPSNKGRVTERVGTRPADTQNQYGYDDSVSKSLTGHSSCKNCGNLLVECRAEVEGKPAIPTRILPDLFTASSLESAQKGRLLIPSHENDVVLLRSQEKVITVVSEDRKSNAGPSNESTPRKMPLPTGWDLSCQPHGMLEDDRVSSFALKHKIQMQERMLRSERIPSGSRSSEVQVKRVLSAANAVSGTKDFVSLNKRISGQARMRSPTKVDSFKSDLERKPSNRQDESLSCVSTFERKRRNLNVSQIEGTASNNSVTIKQRNVSSHAQRGKRRGFDASTPNSSNAKTMRGSKRNGEKVNDNNDNKVNEVASFTFSSPVKQKIVMPVEKEETSSDNEIQNCFQRTPSLRADALGAFLEQKLKELCSQENAEFATGGPSKKPTSVILQEMISALNSGQLTCSNEHTFNDKYEEHHGILLGNSGNSNHLSPGSVLETSFSSRSLDESSGHGFHPDSTNCSCDQMEQLECDAELLDSATSFDNGKICYGTLTELINGIPRILHRLNPFGTRLTESKLTHMKDCIINAELVLGNATEVPQLLLSCFLLDELDTIASDPVWTRFDGFVDCEESEERNQLKGFLFDCVIEYLEANCCQYYNSVFNAWSAWKNLPLCMKAEMLVQEVKSEIKKWACIDGMVLDEIVEMEMSHSLGKWTDFNIEAFEAGVDIDGDVLQILVDEIVEDLVDSKNSTLSNSCY